MLVTHAVASVGATAVPKSASARMASTEAISRSRAAPFSGISESRNPVPGGYCRTILSTAGL